MSRGNHRRRKRKARVEHPIEIIIDTVNVAETIEIVAPTTPERRDWKVWTNLTAAVLTIATVTVTFAGPVAKWSVVAFSAVSSPARHDTMATPVEPRGGTVAEVGTYFDISSPVNYGTAIPYGARKKGSR
jgi:hypothetical protein